MLVDRRCTYSRFIDGEPEEFSYENEHDRHRNISKSTASPQTGDGLLTTTIPRAMASKYARPLEENTGVDGAGRELFADRSAITEPPAVAWSLESLLGSTALIPSFDHFPDPVALGVFTAQEVDVLYDFFFTEMNPFLGLLDPILHTPSHVRNTSSLLYTSILAVASRFLHPDKHSVCSKLAHDHLSTVLVMHHRRKWVATIQSICLLSFWKEPKDDGGWRRIGFAIRLAYEEGLHKSIDVKPNHSDELSFRESLARVRTWLFLNCMDQMMSFQRGLAPMISGEYTFDATAWTGGFTPETASEDVWLMAALDYSELRFQVRTIRQLISGNTKPPYHQESQAQSERLRRSLRLKAVQQNFTKWKMRWQSETVYAILSSKSRLMLDFYAIFMAFYLSSTIFEHSQYTCATSEIGDDNIQTEHFSDCFADALNVIEAIKHIADYRYALLYMPDTVPVAVTAAAVWMVKHTIHLEDSKIIQVTSTLEQAIDQCRNISIHSNDTPAYMSRLLKLLVDGVQRSRSHGARQETFFATQTPSQPKYSEIAEPSSLLSDNSLAVPVPQSLWNMSTSDGDVEEFWSWFQNGQVLPADGVPFAM